MLEEGGGGEGGESAAAVANQRRPAENMRQKTTACSRLPAQLSTCKANCYMSSLATPPFCPITSPPPVFTHKSGVTPAYLHPVPQKLLLPSGSSDGWAAVRVAVIDCCPLRRGRGFRSNGRGLGRVREAVRHRLSSVGRRDLARPWISG